MYHQSDPRTQAPHRLIVPVLMTLIVLGLLIAFGIPESNSAADTSATPFAYLPLIANAGTTVSITPTQMPTTIPTTTNTPTTQTLPCNSVYPIAINASLLDENGFIPPTNPAELAYYGLYSDGIYSNKTQRRLYGRDSFGTPRLDYRFLAWQANETNLTSFSAALTGTGTLYQGFDEVVPWPDASSAAPEGYPFQPHQLTVEDWITVFVSAGADQQVMAAFDNHIFHRTVLALPIYDRIVANGAAESVHFVRVATFLLRGYKFAGSQYLDLVYLGEAAPLNCSSAATATPIASFTVTPSFVTVTPTPTKTDTPMATITSTPASTPTP